jgi:hypothetical protein
MPDTTAGKITLAEVSADIRYLIAAVEKMGVKLDEVKSCQDKYDHIPGEVEALKKTVGDQGNTLIALKTRVDLFGGISAFLSIISGAIGSLFNPKL